MAGKDVRQGEKHKVALRVLAKNDTTKGEYLPFGSLVESFGIHYNREEAISAATRHASKCLQLKGDWLFWDNLGEVPCFLKLRQCYQEEMAECWKLCEEESSSDSQVQARARAKDATPPATAASGQPSGDGQSSGSGQPSTPGQPCSGRGKKRLQAGPETHTPKSGKKTFLTNQSYPRHWPKLAKPRPCTRV